MERINPGKASQPNFCSRDNRLFTDARKGLEGQIDKQQGQAHISRRE